MMEHSGRPAWFSPRWPTRFATAQRSTSIRKATSPLTRKQRLSAITWVISVRLPSPPTHSSSSAWKAAPPALASVPTNASVLLAFTWHTISNYSSEVNSDNPAQIAPGLTNYPAQLYPFVTQGKVSVSGGHFEAGDYNRVTYNGAQLIH